MCLRPSSQAAQELEQVVQQTTELSIQSPDPPVDRLKCAKKKNLVACYHQQSDLIKSSVMNGVAAQQLTFN